MKIFTLKLIFVALQGKLDLIAFAIFNQEKLSMLELDRTRYEDFKDVSRLEWKTSNIDIKRRKENTTTEAFDA